MACVSSKAVKGRSMTTIWPNVYVYSSEDCVGNDFRVIPLLTSEQCINVDARNQKGSWWDSSSQYKDLLIYYANNSLPNDILLDYGEGYTKLI